MQDIIENVGLFLLLMLCYVLFGFEPVALVVLVAIFVRLG